MSAMMPRSGASGKGIPKQSLGTREKWAFPRRARERTNRQVVSPVCLSGASFPRSPWERISSKLRFARTKHTTLRDRQTREGDDQWTWQPLLLALISRNIRDAFARLGASVDRHLKPATWMTYHLALMSAEPSKKLAT